MKLSDLPKNCHCGKIMHLSKSKQMLIKEFGSNWPKEKEVKLFEGKIYTIPTYYILLHGIAYATIPSLGFPEVKT